MLLGGGKAIPEEMGGLWLVETMEKTQNDLRARDQVLLGRLI